MPGPRRGGSAGVVAGLLLAAALGGCQAITNPVANGVPVELLPPELLAVPKDGTIPIPMNWLQQTPPAEYRLGPGDVLAVFVEGVLGQKNEPPPVSYAESGEVPPAIGFPIPIRENGTLPLPLIEPVRLAGLTIEQAEQAVIRAYTTDDPARGGAILKPGRERIIVTLARPRTIRVAIIRQDDAAEILPARNRGRLLGSNYILGGGEVLSGGRRRGNASIIDLPAYQNDLLHALAQSGGLPGIEGKNEVLIQRGYYNVSPDGELSAPIPWDPACLATFGGPIVRIPLRVRPGEPPPFRPEDILLNPGDVVFLGSREAELFYAGGLLPSGEYPIPRDYDLDVIEAISLVGGPMVNGGFATSNLSGTVVIGGFGQPSPSLVSVLRRTPDGRQVTIRIDLREALRDPRSSLILMPGDVVLLQETQGQALARYASICLGFNMISQWTRGATATTGTIAIP